MARHLVRWDPLNDFSALSREMDRLFGRSFDWRFARDERYVPLPIDAYTTEDELVITAALPGVSPDDVEVTFEGDVLTWTLANLG